MFMGGCSCSFADELKVGRWIVFAKFARNKIVKTLQPNQIREETGCAVSHKLTTNIPQFSLIALYKKITLEAEVGTPQ